MKGKKRKFLILAVLLFAFSGSAYAKKKPKTQLVPSPTATPEPKPRWMPPPHVDNDSKALNSTVAVLYSNDAAGELGYDLVDFSAVRKLDENDVSALGTIRFTKPFSSSDNGVGIEVREANISLSEPWMEARLGRMDLSDLVSTTHFFGRYPLMGERRLDGIKVYLPFKFFFGVEDYKSVSSPPTSLSFFYFPTLLSGPNANLDGSQSFFMGQARMKLNFGDLRTVVLFNIGASASTYFHYASLSGNPSYSLCVEANYSKDYTIYCEYGVQDSTHPNDTNAFAFGARAEHLLTWDFLSLDQLTVEAQLPLANNLSNPFIGGNAINPTLAAMPQLSWYGKVRVRIRSIFIDLQVTNSLNDFTLARLNPSNLNTPLPIPVGKGNETDGLEAPLSSTGYATRVFTVATGVSF